jgi:hypothetical protein
LTCFSLATFLLLAGVDFVGVALRLVLAGVPVFFGVVALFLTGVAFLAGVAVLLGVSARFGLLGVTGRLGMLVFIDRRAAQRVLQRCF